MGKVVKKSSALDRAVAKIISGLNLNTLILALITAFFAYLNGDMTDKQDSTIAKVDSSAIKQQVWRARRDSVDKGTNHKLDSIINLLNKKTK